MFYRGFPAPTKKPKPKRWATPPKKKEGGVFLWCSFKNPEKGGGGSLHHNPAPQRGFDFPHPFARGPRRSKMAWHPDFERSSSAWPTSWRTDRGRKTPRRVPGKFVHGRLDRPKPPKNNTRVVHPKIGPFVPKMAHTRGLQVQMEPWRVLVNTIRKPQELFFECPAKTEKLETQPPNQQKHLKS